MKIHSVFTGVACGLLALSFASVAQAAKSKYRCYKLCLDTEELFCYADNLRLVVQPSVFDQKLVYGDLIYPGLFTIGVTGSYPRDIAASGKRRYSLTGSKRVGNAKDATTYMFDGFHNGPWSYQLFETDGSASVTSGELLKKVPCTTTDEASSVGSLGSLSGQ